MSASTTRDDARAKRIGDLIDQLHPLFADCEFDIAVATLATVLGAVIARLDSGEQPAALHRVVNGIVRSLYTINADHQVAQALTKARQRAH